jgi:alkylhydroperoxidase/carboxymuconolactone decarboxylase family protein YurZ
LENETSRGLLGPKITVLVQLVIHASITGLSTSQTRRYVARALELGTSSDEILAVFKLCAVIGIHSMATAMPILDERLEQAMPKSDSGTPQTPTIETLRRRGKFNQAWSGIERWDPVWLDRFLAVGFDSGIENVLGDKTLELLYIAIDATVTHLYCPGIRRHIDAALGLDISPLEIIEVFKLVSLQGIHSAEVGIRILDELSIQQ